MKIQHSLLELLLWSAILVFRPLDIAIVAWLSLTDLFLI